MKAGDIKFTKRGQKKVVFINELNSAESIVQEILVVKNEEIPSGENFVVRNEDLFDERVETWEEKHLRELKETFDTKRSEWNAKIRMLDAEHGKVCDELTAKMAYLRSYISNISLKSFNMINHFLTGKFRYMVEDSWTPRIWKAQDFSLRYERGYLKLATLYGKDDGTMVWGINNYSDGSGGRSYFHLYHTKKEAVKKLTELINAKDGYSLELIEIAKEHKIKLDPKKLKHFKSTCQSNTDAYIADFQKKINEKKKEMKMVNAL